MVLEAELQSGALGWATILSLALFVIALLAYRRARETRVLLVALAFGIFFAKNAVLSYLLLVGQGGAFVLASALLDTAILLAFYVALLRRPRG